MRIAEIEKHSRAVYSLQTADAVFNVVERILFHVLPQMLVFPLNVGLGGRSNRRPDALCCQLNTKQIK